MPPQSARALGKHRLLCLVCNMARNRINEILDRRSREERMIPHYEGQANDVARGWQAGEGPLREAPDFVPIRLVTIIEVFTRKWVENLIDAGEPYLERAAKLLGGTTAKLDFSVVRALAGKQITVGELISHTVSTNSLPGVAVTLNTLIDSDIFNKIDGLPDRWAVEINSDHSPIIPDVKVMRNHLAKLFATRHILVHEIAADKPYQLTDIGDFISASQQFISAVDQFLHTLRYGKVPMQQQQMNDWARENAAAANNELLEKLSASSLKNSPIFSAAQEAWETFRHEQSEFVGGYDEEWPGTLAPLLYAEEYEKLTRARIEEIAVLQNSRFGD
jgi:uncharacterized protein YecT (DUF1311 family)